MENSKCPVTYDNKTKIWKNTKLINDELKVLNLGEVILRELNKFSNEKIIEINIDTGIKTTALEMKNLTINFVINLQKLGIKKGDVIIIFSSMNKFVTPLIYACLIIGAIFVPLEVLYTDDVIEYIFKLVNPSLIAYENCYHDKLKTIIKNLNQIHKIENFLSFESRDDGNSIQQKLVNIKNSIKVIEHFKVPKLGNPEDTIGAYILTSGTTGRPKLMVHSQAHLGLGATTYWDVNETNIIYIASPIRWISQISATLQTVLQKCTRVYATVPPTPKLCAESIQKYKVTHFFSVATFMKQILDYVYKINGNHIKSLEAILTGGERISIKILNTISNLNPNCIVLQCYGMTEMAGVIASDIGTNMKGGCYLLPSIQCKIINEDNKSLNTNEMGLICLKGQTKFGLYLKNDLANKNTFTKDGWLITGDYGKIDENYQLHIYNRYNDLIKFDGKFTIPSLLEAILENHPLLDGSFVIGIPHKDIKRGEIPIAFCKINEKNLENSKMNLDEAKQDILKFINLHIPKDQTAPTEIYFKNDYPYTTCGKVDKLSLRNLVIEKKI